MVRAVPSIKGVFLSVMIDAPSASGNDRAQFRLAGPSRSYDPLRQAIRADLADAAEAHHHFAPHYAAPADWVFTAQAELLASADAGATIVDTAQPGDGFALLDLTGGWAWGYRVANHAVGYVRADLVAPASS